MADLVISRAGSLGCLTLNRPQALNSLNHGMVQDMHRALLEIAADNSVIAVLITGAGERGLCAGGDIRSIHDAQLAGSDLPARFWRDEYVMNAFIAHYPKPYIAFMDGIVMGGGIGVSAHGSHRIVTERTRAAMPEVGIGFSPDVGGTWLLAHAPGELGSFAALTGHVMNGDDAIIAGLADAHVESRKWPDLVRALQDIRKPADIDETVKTFSSTASPGFLASHRGWIDACFAQDTVEGILAALDARSETAAHEAAKTMRRHSPKSLKVALMALRRARLAPDIESCLQMEYRISLACIAAPDMIEGIRAAVIDKDKAPKWNPSTLDGVDDATVEAHFRARSGDAIEFPTVKK